MACFNWTGFEFSSANEFLCHLLGVIRENYGLNMCHWAEVDVFGNSTAYLRVLAGRGQLQLEVSIITLIAKHHVLRGGDVYPC